MGSTVLVSHARYHAPILLWWGAFGLPALGAIVLLFRMAPWLAVFGALFIGFGAVGWARLAKRVDGRYPRLSPLQKVGSPPGHGLILSPEATRVDQWLRQNWAWWFHSAGLASTIEEALDQGPFVEGVRDHPLGVAIRLRAGLGQERTTSKIKTATEALASSLNWPSVRVVDVDALQIDLIAVTRDPFADVVSLDFPSPVRREDFSVEIGRLESGGLVRVSSREAAGVLVTGVPGSGKTVLVQHLLASWLLAGASVWIADFKGSGDFAALQGRADKFVDGDLAAFVRMLEDANELLRARIERSRTWSQPNFWNLTSDERPPEVVIAVDEVQEALETAGVDKERKELALKAQRLLRTLLKQGRSLGFITVLSTQKADASAIPTSIRDQVVVRISGQQMTREASRAALGELAEDSPHPHDPSVIPPQTPGRMVMRTAKGTVVFQAHHLSQAALTGALGGLPGHQ